MDTDINRVVIDVEAAVTAFADAKGRRAREVRVRPSGDDARAIKVWVDLGPGVDDDACEAWAAAVSAAAAPAAAGYTIEARAESL